MNSSTPPGWNTQISSSSKDCWQSLGLSFVHTSGHCRRGRSRMEVKMMAGSLFVYCKIAYIYSETAEKWLLSLPNFVTIRRTHLSISCKIFRWIRTPKLKIQAMEFCDFIKDSVSPSGFCTLLTDRDKHAAAKADSSLSNRRASLSRSLATGLSVDYRIPVDRWIVVTQGLNWSHPHHQNKYCFLKGHTFGLGNL